MLSGPRSLFGFDMRCSEPVCVASGQTRLWQQSPAAAVPQLWVATQFWVGLETVKLEGDKRKCIELCENQNGAACASGNCASIHFDGQAKGNALNSPEGRFLPKLTRKMY